MKRNIILLLSLITISFFLGSCKDNNKNSKPKESAYKANEYQKAREIISSLDSIVNPNGIQQNFQMNIGGIKQWVYVRGQNKNNPIIIFVHGGPGSPMAPEAWAFQRPFEEYFTMVQYDQRAAGKTFLSNDTVNLAHTLTIEQYANDLIQLTDSIRKKYHKKKVILVGHSWGTIVSMTAVLKRPDLFYAYVGVGQVINARENEHISFEYALKQAKERHDTVALKELQAIAPYPGNQPLTEKRILVARKWAQYYGGLAAYRHNTNYYFMLPYLSPLYSKKDVDEMDKGTYYSLPKLLPQLLSVNFQSVKKFPIPVFMFMGRHDYTTPSGPTSKWISQVKAPVKEGVWFENSAHLIPLEEPGKMLITLVDKVRPLAEVK